MPYQIPALPALWSGTLYTSCHQDKTWDISNLKGEILFFLMVWEGSIHGYLPSCLDIMMTRHRKRVQGRTGKLAPKDTSIPTDLLPPHLPTTPSHYNLIKRLMCLVCWTSQDLTDTENINTDKPRVWFINLLAFPNPIKWQLWLTI